MGSREAPYDKHKECDNCGKWEIYIGGPIT